MTVGTIGEDRSSNPFRTYHDEGPRKAQPKALGLSDVYAAARRRLVLIVAITLAGTLLSLLASVSIEKVYTARSMILLKPDDPNLLDMGSPAQPTQPGASRLDTETDLMTSRVFAGRIVDRLSLIADPDFNTFLPEPKDDDSTAPVSSLLPPALSPVASRIEGLMSGLSEKEDAPLPPIAVQRDRAITVLLSKIAVTRSGESYAVTVTATDGDPKMAATLADAVTKLYMEWSSDLKLGSTKDAVEFLRQQAKDLALRIATLESDIATYGREKNVSSDPRDDLLRATLQHANEQLSTARGELTQAQSRLDQVRGGGGGAQGDIGPLLASDFLTKLRGEEATALNERAQIARNFGANHPLIKEADAKVASTRTMIAEEARRIGANVENDVRVAQGRVQKLEQELASSELELRRRAEADIHLRELNRDLMTEQQLYDVVAARLGKLDPYAAIAKPNASVVSFAAVPIEPSFPKPHTLVAGGFVGSLFLAFVVVVGLEAMDTRVRDARHASQLVRAPALASVPKLPRRLRRRSHGVIDHMCRNPRSAISESFRSIHAALRRAHGGRAGQIVLVTSGLPREGKTTTAVGLSVGAALEGARTVLVDFDLRTAGLGTTAWLGPHGHDLDDHLDGWCGLGDVVRPVPGVPRLDVVTSSARAIHQPGVLSAETLAPLMRELRSRYDFIVIDSPPMLVVDDTIALAPHADCVVIVTAWGGATQDALSETGRRLLANDIAPTGVVLNGVDPKLEGASAFCRTRAHRRQVRRYFLRHS